SPDLPIEFERLSETFFSLGQDDSYYESLNVWVNEHEISSCDISFFYKAPRVGKPKNPPITLSFDVEPDFEPPANIHVLIGCNGVGKTTLLHNMARALVDERADASQVGEFFTEADDLGEENPFANLVSVTFSAFDPFEPLPTPRY